RRLQAGADFAETGAAQALGGGFRRSILPQALPSAKEALQGRDGDEGLGAAQEHGQIGAAAALRFQPATRTQHAMQAAKEALMVLDPMKGSSAENSICSRAKRQLLQVGHYEPYVPGKARLEPAPRRLQHIG